MRRWRRTLLLGAVAAATVLAPAMDASAGVYGVRSCVADSGRFSTQAFQQRATRGMRIRRACNLEGEGIRGLLTGNVVRRGRVKQRARAIVFMEAPGGTAFRAFRWSGTTQRLDCRYAIQVYAEGPNIPPVPIKNVRANRRCPKGRSARAAGLPKSKVYNVPGATRIVQRVICVGNRRSKSCSTRRANFVRTLTAEATLEDFAPPSVQITGGGLASGRWVKGTQEVTFDASDNVGVKEESADLSALNARQTRSCNDSLPAPCPNGPGRLQIDTERSAEGAQQVTVGVADASGNRSSDTRTAYIDHTSPSRVDVGVVGGQEWRNSNSFGLQWTNPSEPDRAPIAAAHYRICQRGVEGCGQVGQQQGDGLQGVNLTVPGPGEWNTTVWREDAAGNADEKLASVPVTLRYDPEPPQLGFEQSIGTDPTRVSVLVTDRVSGLAGGEIEMRRQGTNTWQTLSTQRESSRITTRLDDSRIPPGVYELRARAIDQARNEASTTSRLDGSPMVLTLPLRTTAFLKAGFRDKRVIRRVVRRRGKKRVVRRRVDRLSPDTKVRLGRKALVMGELTDASGQGIPNATVAIASGSGTSPGSIVGTVMTDLSGRFRYVAHAGRSQVLSFGYFGSGGTLPAQGQATLRVPATSSFRASKRRLLNGQRVTFRGGVPGPVPQGGKLVEVQVQLSGRWQTFRTTRTDAGGKWRVGYRFRRTRGVQRYRFRARLPQEGAYPFEAGRSRSIRVNVRGQ